MSDSRIRAGADNHRSFFARAAAAAGGAAHFRYGGVVANQPGGSLMVGFADIPAAELAAFADEVVGLARQELRPFQVGWWTLDEPAARTIGAPLLARGFHWGWRPNWMALDPAHLVTDHPVPAKLKLEPTESGFEAWLAGKRVGHVAYHRSDYAGQPVGGIYDMGVEPEARRQGIGTALTVAACRQLTGDSPGHGRGSPNPSGGHGHATTTGPSGPGPSSTGSGPSTGGPSTGSGSGTGSEQGCRLVMLNATGLGQPVYARAGFEHLGEYGQTWWLPKHTIDAAAPSRASIRFLEALGTGDLDTVAAAYRQEEHDLDALLPCDLTPLGIATKLDRPESARWLVDHGATLDVASAWSLGWRDEAAELLANDPALVHRRTGSWQLSPLHVAAFRGDIELARLILAANPDLTATDSVLHKDPAEWAHLHGHPDVGKLIEDWRSTNAG